MSLDSLAEFLDGPFALTSRPEPIPGDLRRGWGIAIILLMLGRSYGKKASLQKLHFLAYSIRTQYNRQLIQAVFDGERSASDIIIRIEPWLTRALSFAKGAQLLTIEKGKSAKLTIKGVLALAEIMRDSSIFNEEKLFLEKIAKQSTEEAVNKIMKLDFTT